MRKIILMSGIPGSGKSFESQRRISAHIKETNPPAESFSITCDPVSRPVMPGNGWKTSSPIILLSCDDYFIQQGKYTFRPDLIGDAHGLCLKSYIRGVQDTLNQLIVVDNTNTTNEELAPYIAIAQAYKIPVEVVTVMVSGADLDKAAQRNTHGVPTNTIGRMWSSIQNAKPPFHWSSDFGVDWFSVDAVFAS